MKNSFCVATSFWVVLMVGSPLIAQLVPLTPEDEAEFEETIARDIEESSERSGEEVFLVKKMQLAPAPDSPVQDLKAVGYILSDGSRTYTWIVEVPEQKTPAGREIHADLEAGTYWARDLSAAELKYYREKPKSAGWKENRTETTIIDYGAEQPELPLEEPALDQDAEDPLSHLGSWLLDLLIPSAHACFLPCPSETFTHSYILRGFEATQPNSTLVAETRGKLNWRHGPPPNPCQLELQGSQTQTCNFFSPWTNPECTKPTPQAGIIPFLGWRAWLDMRTAYELSHAGGTTTLRQDFRIEGSGNDQWVVKGTLCKLFGASPPTSVFCMALPDNF